MPSHDLYIRQGGKTGQNVRSTNNAGAFPGLLLVSLLGVYVLVMLGATTAVTDALATCTTWPTCDGRWIVPLSDPAAIAWGHRLAAAVVGMSLLATAIAAIQWSVGIRVKVLIAVGLTIYLLQVVVGAATVLQGGGGLLSGLHLGLGMALFGALVLAFAWSLEQLYPQESAIDSITTANEEHAEPAPIERSWRTVAGAYIQMTKPRLMWLLCLVAAAGMALAAGPTLQISTIIATLGAGVLAIGASGTFNHVLERDVDRRMKRTADRPLATDLIPVRNAIVFGCILAVASIAIFAIFLNVLAAALGLAAIVFYSVVYTLILKPNTVQNTVIGGFAGALPALIGWAAVTGSIGWPAVLLALVIFCWTPAHFYNLAMAYRDDYARGGFPMLPVERGDRVARKHIIYYAGATLLVAAGLAAAGSLGWLYAAAAIVAGAGFFVAIKQLHEQRTRRAAFRTFHASNAYLGVLLVVVTIDALVL